MLRLIVLNVTPALLPGLRSIGEAGVTVGATAADAGLARTLPVAATAVAVAAAEAEGLSQSMDPDTLAGVAAAAAAELVTSGAEAEMLSDAPPTTGAGVATAPD